jgi:hypothetical protein
LVELNDIRSFIIYQPPRIQLHIILAWLVNAQLSSILGEELTQNKNAASQRESPAQRLKNVEGEDRLTV